MKKSTTSLLAGLMLMGTTVGQVHASELVDATDPYTILAIAQDYGAASLDTDDAGDPLIEGEINGLSYKVTFYGCNQSGESCRAVLFNAGFFGEQNLTPEERLDKANAWNDGKVFGRVSIDDDGDYYVDMAVNLHEGVSRANLDDTFDWWRVVLNGFKSY